MSKKRNKVTLSCRFVFSMVLLLLLSVVPAKAADSTEYQTVKASLRTVEVFTADEAKAYIGIDPPKCKNEGYIFAGWYADEACEKTPIRSAGEVTEKAYALFVAKEVLSVKAQITDFMEDTDATNDKIGAIRFVTTVDTLNYKQVGFKIAFDKDGDGENSEYTSATDKVYTQLRAVDSATNTNYSLLPSEFCEISKFFKACTVKNVAEEFYELEFVATPFWETLDGVVVDGVSTTKVINDHIASKYEAKDNSMYYTVLEEAVAAAKTSEPDVITVMRDVELESPMTIKEGMEVTVQNRAKRDVTIYRGKGLAYNTTFNIDSGATLTIAGSAGLDSIVLDGRTKAEAEANVDRDNMAGSVGSLFDNSGVLHFSNLTIQYVGKNGTGTGAVVLMQGNRGAVMKVTSAKFINNKAGGVGGVAAINGGNGRSEFDNVIFENNVSGENGGAICNHSALNLTNCKFTGNQVASGDNTKQRNGGAIYNGTSAVLTITGTDENMAVFANNKTGSGYGGAIGVGSGRAVICGYKFEGNHAATFGGALYLTGTGTDAYNDIQDVTFVDNHAEKNRGGAIHVQSVGKFKGIKCVFERNTASEHGGAINIEGCDSTQFHNEIQDSKFVQNSALVSNGGAIYIRYDASTNIRGCLDIRSCEFTQNHADGSNGKGGALHVEGGIVTASDSDFIENTAKIEGGAVRIASGGTATFESGKFEGNNGGSMGGAIKYNSGTLTIKNYTFTGNIATNSNGNDIKLNFAFDKKHPTLTACTFDPAGIVDLNGEAGTYQDGGGNTTPIPTE